MKKLFLSIAIILFLCSNVVMAEEKNQQTEVLDPASTQEMQFQENKALLVVQKQPLSSTHSQSAKIRNNWFCVIVQVNGKIKVNPITSTYEVE